MPHRPCINCGALITNASRCGNCKPARQRNGWTWTAFKHQHKKTYCEECGNTDRLDLHHIRPLHLGGPELDPANTVTLCHTCHQHAPVS